MLYPSLFGPRRGCYIAYSIRNRFLHSPMTLCPRRYCILVYLVLGEVIRYAQLCPAIPCLRDRFLHSPVTLHTWRCCILVCSLLGELISYASYALPGGPVPTPTSDLAYPVILYHSLFGPGEVISYDLPAGPVPALTSNPMYPMILYPSLFGPERGY